MTDKYWPGTNVPKSTGNAFTIRTSSMFDTPMHRASVVAKTNGAKGVRSGFGKDTPQASSMNTKKLPAGVSLVKSSGSYRVSISRDGSRRYLGFFRTLAEATKARKDAEQKLGPSKRAREVLKTAKNQVVIEPKGGSIRRDQIKRGGI